MWAFFHYSLSPKNAYKIAGIVQPIALCVALLLLCYGLYAGLYLAPPDYQQGDVFRIIYIHVPCAIFSLLAYGVASVAAFVFLVWKVKVADLLLRSSLVIGAVFTFLTLLTGSIWGRPTWGTYWIWDARLTTELILLFIYFAIISLRSAMQDSPLAAKAAAILTIVCAIDLPIIHYSVDWWHTLHQGASLSLTNSTIAPSMLHPLLAMMAAFFCLYVAYLCVSMKTLLLVDYARSAWVKKIFTSMGGL